MLIAIAAAVEIVSGAAMIAVPALVARLMFDVSSPGAPMIERAAGLGVLCLGLATWPSPAAPNRRGRDALLAYNALTTLYLIGAGLSRTWSGPLLWPAAAVHGVLTALLAGRTGRGPAG